MFIGMIPKTFTNEDLLRMLEPHGTIEELNILKSADGKSKGTWLVLVCTVYSVDVHMHIRTCVLSGSEHWMLCRLAIWHNIHSLLPYIYPV